MYVSYSMSNDSPADRQYSDGGPSQEGPVVRLLLCLVQLPLSLTLKAHTVTVSAHCMLEIGS